MWFNESVRGAMQQCYRNQRKQSDRLSHPKTQRQKFMGPNDRLGLSTSQASHRKHQSLAVAIMKGRMKTEGKSIAVDTKQLATVTALHKSLVDEVKAEVEKAAMACLTCRTQQITSLGEDIEPTGP
jgi:hypothetical protein